MFEPLVKAIQDGVEVKEITIGGEIYTTQPVYRVPEIPTPAKLQIATLQGIVDYLTSNIDETEKGQFFVHVASYKSVNVVKFLGELNERAKHVEAVYETSGFAFGREHSQTEFITGLQSRFVDTENRRALQKLVGGLSDESSLHLQDDGISQQTVAKTGITTKDRVNLPNPLTLQPYRTFAEVEQPESAFILRLHKREDKTPLISLHEADNEGWKVAAVENIKKFLADKVKVPVIA